MLMRLYEGKGSVIVEENAYDDLRLYLQAVMPNAKNISGKQCSKLYGLVRRSLLWEKQEETEATQVYRPESTNELQFLIQSLNLATEEEIKAAVEELQLSPEEKELEYVHWAFRRQSANGEILIQDALIAFKLVRMNQYQYLLLCRENNADVADSFTRAFNHTPDIFSEHALMIEDKSCAGWMWILDPDKERANQMKEEISALWKVKK
ncbi:hypothetical protein KAR34_01725 [bacterium]|nr:hypothetical protein [bacterium]